jgi:hypothetical protein
VGFEPTRARALAVFKTAAFDHSATPPRLQDNTLAEDVAVSSGDCYELMSPTRLESQITDRGSGFRHGLRCADLRMRSCARFERSMD